MTILPVKKLSIVQMVLLRPRMFTASGGLTEVVAFISGFEAAAKQATSNAADNSPTDFLNWMNSEAGIDRAIFVPPSELIEAALQRFGSESAILDAASRYFRIDDVAPAGLEGLGQDSDW